MIYNKSNRSIRPTKSGHWLLIWPAFVVSGVLTLLARRVIKPDWFDPD